VLLTPEEKAAALHLAGVVPLATWMYQLVRRELDKSE
jgi:hypothetical protein